MNRDKKCPRCGRRHSAQALDGLCPDCLVRVTLGGEAGAQEPDAPQAEAKPKKRDGKPLMDADKRQ